MKRIFGVLNLILCLELIVGPHFPGLKIFSANTARAETCPTGLVHDATLNRCITSDQQAALINATASCNGDKECYKRLAEEELKKGEEEGKIAEAVANKSGLINTGAKIAAIAGPLTVVMGAFRNKKCLNPSGMAMIAGGVAFTAGDFMANKKHKSCLKKIREDWEKNKAATSEKTSSGASKVSMSQDQSEAFEMLAKSEECMQSSAKMKAGFYAGATVAFAASAVLALMVNPAEESPCSSSDVRPAPAQSATPGNPSRLRGLITYIPQIESSIFAQAHNNLIMSESPEAVIINAQIMTDRSRNSCASIEEYETIKEQFSVINEREQRIELTEVLKLALSGLKNEFSLVSNAEASTPAAPLEGILGKLNSRMGRAIMGGVLAGLSAMMWMHANKQARVAKNRAEFLRKLKDEFNDSVGAISCSAEERSMSGNANCYCYTEDGKRNPARNNSQVCQQLWTGKTLAAAGDYNSLDFSNQRVCISASGAADESCACKQTKSCLNAIPGVSGNLGLGAISVASNGLRPVNDLANGNIGAGSINGAAALQGAARLLDEKKKLENKARIDPKKSAKAANDIVGALTAASGSVPSPFQNSSPLPLNMSPGDAARALERELDDSGRSFERVNGSPALAQPGNDRAADDFRFSMDNPQPAASTDQQVAEVMAQDFNYNNNDITQSNSNLFQILTNRYQRSGMRRLFDEGGKAQPEPAAQNDISQ